MDKTGYTNYAVYITRSEAVARMIGKSILNDTGDDSTVTVSYGTTSANSYVIPPIYQTKGFAVVWCSMISSRNRHMRSFLRERRRYMFNEVEAKARLIKMKRRQADLVLELRKRGIQATPTEVAQSMNWKNVFPKGDKIRSEIIKILDDWEANEAR